MVREAYQRSSTASRQASGKLGKCLKEGSCIGELCQCGWKKFCNGQSEGGGKTGE